MLLLESPLNNLYKTCLFSFYTSSVNTLTHATERFLSYPLMSLLRQVLQPLLQHDPRTPPRASLSLYKITLRVSISIQTVTARFLAHKNFLENMGFSTAHMAKT